MTDHLDNFGDVEVEDVGSAGAVRGLGFVLKVPGDPCNLEVKATYRERYLRVPRGGWEIAKYTYEYLDLTRGWRLAYHLHDLDGRKRIPHAHCEPIVDPDVLDESRHLRATEYELLEAHAEFMKLFALGVPPDCKALRPLVVRRG